MISEDGCLIEKPSKKGPRLSGLIHVHYLTNVAPVLSLVAYKAYLLLIGAGGMVSVVSVVVNFW